MLEITQALRERASSLGIPVTANSTKTTLVRRIQIQEGHIPCYRTDLRDSCKGTCEWADDCRDCLVASWMR